VEGKLRRLILAVAVVAVSTVATAPSARADDGGGRHDRPVVHTDFNPKDFKEGPKLSNRYLALDPGTEFTLEGTTSQGVHSIVLTVTDLVKKVSGVQSRVIWDVDRQDDVLAEAELAFMAQDDDGNVWNTGEYPEEYTDGVFTGAPRTWIGLVEDALPGVGMRARPRPGTPTYFQALVPSIEFGDTATVTKIIPKFCIKLGCFSNVVQIEETNSFVPDEGTQIKYYAPGVGNIRIDFVGGTEQESLELVSVRHLDDKARDAANKAALKLDGRAYKVAPDIYGGTPKAKRETDK
jgi:hypothetical protein